MIPHDPPLPDRRFFQDRFLGRDATVLGGLQIGAAAMLSEALIARDIYGAVMMVAFFGLATLGLLHVLGRIARGKGYPPGWRWFALLGLIGVLVVRLLPDRTRHAAPRGFPLDPPGGPGQ